MNTTAQPPDVRRSAPPAKASRTVKDWIEDSRFKDQIARALPKHLTPDRFLRVALTATIRTPGLLDCTPESVTSCLLQCSQMGLEPDGRRAHLIPFKDKNKGVTICTLIVDYKGLAELAMRSGLVSYLHADVVREGDIFEFSIGEIIAHKPWFLRRDADKPAEPGQDIAVYALARMKDGTTAASVLSMDEVYAIRDGSQGWKAFKAGYTKQSPWDPANWVSEQEMKKKTGFRRLSKLLPLSPEIRDALDVDDEDGPVAKARNVTPRTPEIPAPAFRRPEPIEQREPETQTDQPDPDPVEAAETADRHADPGTDNAIRSVRFARPEKAAPAVTSTPNQAPTAAPAAAAPAGDSPQAQLEAIITGAGLTLDDYNRWCIDQQETPMEFPSWGDVPTMIAARHVKAKTGLVRMVGAMKGGAQ